jgi:hypothetical protein
VSGFRCQLMAAEVYPPLLGGWSIRLRSRHAWCLKVCILIQVPCPKNLLTPETSKNKSNQQHRQFVVDVALLDAEILELPLYLSCLDRNSKIVQGIFSPGRNLPERHPIC